MEDNQAFIHTAESLQDHTLTINPEGFKGKYGCMITFDNGTTETTLRYKLNIYSKGKPTAYTYVYKIDREPQLYVNDVQPEDVLDQIAIEVGQVIYPLEVEMSREGKLIRVLNFEAIQERWKKKKKTLQETYTGPIVDRYCKQTDQTLSNGSIFLEKIKKDWCLRLYFSPLYTHYEKGYAMTQTITYPIAGKAAPVAYTVQQKITDVEDNDTKDIMVTVQGKITDDRCALDLEQELDVPYYAHSIPNAEALKGTCELKYLLAQSTGIIEACEANFETEFSVPKKVTVKLFLLEHLKEEYSVLVEEEDEEIRPKKTFWARLFNK